MSSLVVSDWLMACCCIIEGEAKRGLKSNAGYIGTWYIGR